MQRSAPERPAGASSLTARAGRLAPAAAIAAGAVATLTLTGWALGVEALASLAPGQVTMKANAAAGVLLAAAALWTLTSPRASAGALRVGTACAAAAGALGALTLVEYAGGLSLGIDELLFREAASAVGTSHPGRMAPNAALGLLVAGATMVALRLPEPRSSRAAHTGAGFLALLSLVILGARAHGVTALFFEGAVTQMALPTAVAFLLLSAGVLCARPDTGVMPLVLSDGAAGSAIRGLLPVAVATPLVLAVVRLAGQDAGLYRTRQGVWLFTLAVTCVMVAVSWVLARSLHRSDVRRRRSEQVLRASEERYRALTESAQELIVSADTDGKIIYMNPAAERAFGHSPAEALGAPLTLLMPERFHAAHTRGLRRLARGGEPHLVGRRVELAGRRSDGNEFSVELSLTRWRTNGHSGFTGVMRDISERKRAEKLAWRQQRELGRALMLAKLGTWTVEPASGQVSWSDEMCRIHGLEPGGWPRSLDAYLPMVHPDDRDRVERSAERAQQGGASGSLEHRIVGGDGILRWLSTTWELVDDDPGHVVGTTQDITESKAVQRAEAHSRAKSALLTRVSHELRIPLNGVIGMTELLLDSDLTAEQREYARMAYTSGETLLTLIDNILDLSKIEAGKLSLDVADFDLRGAVHDVCGLLAVRARRRGLAFDCHVAETMPARVRGDETRLRQLLFNLVGNAVKFTEAGGVTVRLDRARADGERVAARLEVSDTGIGIDPAAIAELFEPFAQADQSSTHRFGGTGLGLAICRNLVELMGGDIGADSAPGRGSTFWCVLPFAAVHDDGGQAPSRATAAPTTARVDTPTRGRAPHPGDRALLLVAEDDPVSRMLAERLLERRGHRVDVVTDGRAAVAATARARYAAVFMDCRMPVMDGFEATQRIRRQQTGTWMPIVAMTANTLEADRERCLAAGMDDYLTKPLRGSELEAVLARWVTGETSQQFPEPRTADGDRTGEPPQPVVDITVLDELRQDVGDAVVAELLDTFRRHTPERLAALRQAVRARDPAAVERQAHSLAGSVGAVGAARMTELSAAIQRAAEGGEQAPLDALLQSMHDAWEQTREALEAV